MGISTDEIVVSAPLRQTSGPAGARWVEAARTELGQLATLGGLFDNGFNEKKRKGSTTATAETAFLLAIDASEKDTDRKDSTPPRHEMPKLIRPAQPIFGDTEPMTPPCPAPAPIQQVARPRLSIAPEAVRAILAQPTAMLAPSDDPEALQRITIGPVGPAAAEKPRAKSFVPPKGARKSSFVGRLGVAVVAQRPSRPPPPTATSSGHHRVMVVSQSPRTRAWNMAAAVMSGLAAAMAVMAVVVSI